MASARSIPTPFSSCLACRSSFQPSQSGSRTQVAYKWAIRNVERKNSFKDNVTIRLLKDHSRYGKAGRIIQITRGQMRREFQPKKIGKYIVGDELKRLEAGKQVKERDYAFKTAKELRMLAKEQAEEKVMDAFSTHLRKQLQEREEKDGKLSARVAADLKLMEAREMTTEMQVRIMQALSPTYKFPRAVNDKAAGVGSNGPYASGTPIFGSVTAGDVAAAVRAELALDPALANFTVDDASILFHDLDAASDQRRLKALGAHEVDVTIGGAVIRRTVEVVPNEEEEKTLHAGSVADTQIEAAKSAEAQAKGAAESGALNPEVVEPSESADELNKRASLEGALAKMRARKRGQAGQ